MNQKLMLTSVLGFLGCLTFSTLALGSGPAASAEFARNHQHEASPQELQGALETNRHFHQSRQGRASAPRWQPVADTADFGYVLMSSEEGTSEVTNLRRTIAQNLPAGVKLVVLATQSEASAVRARFSRWIDSGRLIVAIDSGDISGGFWARDSFPVPVVDNTNLEKNLISAHYYRPFGSSEVIASAVHSPMEKENFVFVGGNLIADEEGSCFSIRSYRQFEISESDYQSIYGCKQTHILKHAAGIGDVDEVLKPLSGRRVLTSIPEYVSDLKKWGFAVTMLPRPAGDYRTYANALIVKDVVFMPTYGVSEDQQAAQVYQGLGYRVVPIRSNDLSDQMHGSIHCQTMAYPKMSDAELFRILGLKKFP